MPQHSASGSIATIMRPCQTWFNPYRFWLRALLILFRQTQVLFGTNPVWHLRLSAKCWSVVVPCGGIVQPLRKAGRRLRCSKR